MQNYFFKHVDHDYLAAFVKQYYPHDLLTQMKNQNLVLALHDAKAKFVRMESKLGVFVVRGEQTRKMDGVAPTARTVVLSILIRHHPDGKSMVEEVTDITPDDGGTDSPKGNGSAKGIDPLKAAEDGVKDYQSAVNAAGDAKSATDKAKGILGF